MICPMDRTIADEIYENQSLINRICYSFCSDEDDRKDLFQEIVYRILISYNGFNKRSSFSTWLYRVSLNTAITCKKKRRPVTYNSDRIERYDSPAEESDVSTEIEKLYSSIDCLKRIDRAIILLYLEENSYEQISEITGFTVKDVSVKIVRIKAKLAEIYDDDYLATVIKREEILPKRKIIIVSLIGLAGVILLALLVVINYIAS